MILSLIATGDAASKWLTIAKVSTTVGTTYAAIHPVEDIFQKCHE